MSKNIWEEYLKQQVAATSVPPLMSSATPPTTDPILRNIEASASKNIWTQFGVAGSLADNDITAPVSKRPAAAEAIASAAATKPAHVAPVVKPSPAQAQNAATAASSKNIWAGVFNQPPASASGVPPLLAANQPTTQDPILKKPISIVGLATNGDSMHKAFNDLLQGATLSQRTLDTAIKPLHDKIKDMPFENKMRYLASEQARKYKGSHAYQDGALTPEQQLMYVLNRAHAYENPKGIAFQEPTRASITARVDTLYNQHIAAAKKHGIPAVAAVSPVDVAKPQAPASASSAPASVSAPTAPTAGGAVHVAEAPRREEPAAGGGTAKPRASIKKIDKQAQYDLEVMGYPTGQRSGWDASKPVEEMDGIAGKVTRPSITKFLKENGLEAFDAAAIAKLHELAEAKRAGATAAEVSVDTSVTGADSGVDATLAFIASNLKAGGNPISGADVVAYDTPEFKAGLAQQNAAMQTMVAASPALANDTIKAEAIKALSDKLTAAGVEPEKVSKIAATIDMDAQGHVVSSFFEQMEKLAGFADANAIYDARDAALSNEPQAMQIIAGAIKSGKISIS